MEQTIFNSDKSRTKIDLKFNNDYWWLRSTDYFHGSIGYVYHNTNIYYYNAIKCIGVVPVCMI